MTEMNPEQESNAPASKPSSAPTPVAAPAAAEEAPAEATVRLVLVPDALNEAYVAYHPELGQFHIDHNGVEVPVDAADFIIEQAAEAGLNVKEA